jgi:hypothetical protein
MRATFCARVATLCGIRSVSANESAPREDSPGGTGLAQVLARLRRSYARDTPGGIGSGIDAEAVGSAFAVGCALHIGTPHRRRAAGPAPPGIDAGAAGSTAARRAVASVRTGAEGQAAFGAAPNIEADAAGSAGVVSRACPRRTGRRLFYGQDAGPIPTRPARTVGAVQPFDGLALAVFALRTRRTRFPGARLRQVE